MILLMAINSHIESVYNIYFVSFEARQILIVVKVNDLSGTIDKLTLNFGVN
jgi:hypothetical protein